MIRIEFNAAAVFDHLDQARSALGDMSPVYAGVVDYVVEATKKRFVSSIGPDGTRWREKSPATLAAYLRRKDGNRPKPLIGPSGRLGKEIVGIATREAAEIGSNLEYSGVMQGGAKKGAFGTTRTGRPVPWGDIPARPFLGLSAEDERTIIDIVDEHLENAIGA